MTAEVCKPSNPDPLKSIDTASLGKGVPRPVGAGWSSDAANVDG